MAQLPNFREQIHEEKYDTLIRGVGVSTIGTKTTLFSSQNVGRPQLTNMQEGGRLSNEENFLVLSIRFYVQFATGIMYRYIEDGIVWTFKVANKNMMGPLPLYVAPAGGGMCGNDVNAQGHVITNGTPDWSGILKFGKPVEVEKNQHFGVDIEFYDFDSLDGNAAAISPRLHMNADVNLKIVQCFLGGVLERQVQ